MEEEWKNAGDTDSKGSSAITVQGVKDLANDALMDKNGKSSILALLELMDINPKLRSYGILISVAMSIAAINAMQIATPTGVSEKFGNILQKLDKSQRESLSNGLLKKSATITLETAKVDPFLVTYEDKLQGLASIISLTGVAASGIMTAVSKVDPTNGGIAASSITIAGTDTIKMKNVDVDFSKGLTPVVESLGNMPAAVKTFDDLVKSLV